MPSPARGSPFHSLERRRAWQRIRMQRSSPTSPQLRQSAVASSRYGSLGPASTATHLASPTGISSHSEAPRRSSVSGNRRSFTARMSTSWSSPTETTSRMLGAREKRPGRSAYGSGKPSPTSKLSTRRQRRRPVRIGVALPLNGTEQCYCGLHDGLPSNPRMNPDPHLLRSALALRAGYAERSASGQ